MSPRSEAGGARADQRFLAERLRFRQLTSYCLIAWIIYTLVHTQAGYRIAATVEGVAAVCTALILGLGLRVGQSSGLRLAANANLVITTLALAALSLNGALVNDSAWFLVLTPLLAAYQLGEKAGKAWAIVTAIVLVLLVQLNNIYQPKPEWDFKASETNRNRVILVVLTALFGVASSRAARTQLQAAEKASEAKSEFLTAMSHELRTPLNAVIGFSQMLDDEIPGPLNPKQKKYQKNISSAASHLLELVTDVLDLARIDAGQITLNRELVELGTLVENVVSDLKPLTQAKSLDVKTECSQLPPVWADDRRVRQILINLINNAIKFTPAEGYIRVAGELEASGVHLSVEDSGIGLEPESLDVIFERFHQVDSGFSRAYEGTGLGLAVTQELVLAHGGSIWVTSDGKGQGSTFHFTLPVQSED